MLTSPEKPESKWDKVAIRLENRVIKGFVESREGDTLDVLLSNATAPQPGIVRIRRLDDGTIEEIPVEQAKAVFYVKEFDGDPARKHIHFYRSAPIVHWLWIRLEFNDGEIMEGLVHNTIDYLVNPGFFMRPTDPRSNNRLVYVTKHWLKECRVLGLRDV